MAKKIILLLLLLVFLKAGAQPFGNIWIFGQHATVDFSGANPAVATLPNAGGGPPYWNYDHAGAICGYSGQLLFWCKVIGTNNPVYNVFSANGQSMPNGALFFTNISGADFVPVFVPHPVDTNKFYIFYINNGGLQYSLVDMNLNGGLGDIVANQKNILLGNFGDYIIQKITTVKGCSGVWVVVRSRNNNQFHSYEITPQGISNNPTVSVAGSLPLPYYGGYTGYSGLMKSAVGGGRIAVVSGIGAPGNTTYPLLGGLELFDIEPCSGTVSNSIVLDTGFYYSTCFSPDNSKLYASRMYDKQIYQFDLSLGTTAAIIVSKTLIFTSAYNVGDMKRSDNGKIYIGNNACGNDALNVIAQPNLAGLACQPAFNVLSLGNSCTGLNLPADIITAPHQDTVYSRKQITSCFQDTVLLKADSPGSCYYWENGQTGRKHIATHSGDYIVYYADGSCTLHIDTFSLLSIPALKLLPGSKAFNCPGKAQGAAWMSVANDTATYLYTWINATGNLLQQHSSAYGDTLNDLDTGVYTVHIQAKQGCDTSFRFIIHPLPVPIAGFTGDTLVCKGAISIYTDTSIAPMHRWLLQYGKTSTALTLEKLYTIASDYAVTLEVTNIEGCSDTVRKTVHVIELPLSLMADTLTALPGTEITLNALSDSVFSAVAWTPKNLFSDQADQTQQFRLMQTTEVTVTGKSGMGCIDSATVKLQVEPLIIMPTAFSPNGDGLNDRFHPVSIGEKVLIRSFDIYNRWGQQVWSAWGTTAILGWDGTYRNQPCDMGAYFYSISMETPAGTSSVKKGDVTLVR